MNVQRWCAATMLGATLGIAACGPAARDADDETPTPHEQATARATAPTATGRVITIELVSDDSGNYFKPREVEAHRGDVLRFVLTSGVHNISFVPDSNPGKTGLPAPSAMLQLPGQTLDIPVTFPPGHYHFQCDPHAPLGMTGRLEVEDTP